MPPAGATPPRWSWQRFETKRNDQEAALAPDTPRSRAGRAPRPASDTAAPSAHLDGVPYVELHAHSNYSLLEGASHPSELIAQALARPRKGVCAGNRNSRKISLPTDESLDSSICRAAPKIAELRLQLRPQTVRVAGLCTSGCPDLAGAAKTVTSA